MKLHPTWLGFLLGVVWIFIMYGAIAIATELGVHERMPSFYDRWVIPVFLGVVITGGALLLLFSF